MARDLYGEIMGRALQRQAPQGHMPAFITQGEADVLRSLGGGVSPNGGQIMRNGIPSFQYDWSPRAGREQIVSEMIDTSDDILRTLDDIERTNRAGEQNFEEAIHRGRTQEDIDWEALQAENALERQRAESNTGGSLPSGSSAISQYEIQPLLQQLIAGSNTGGSLPPASFIGGESQFTNEAPLNVRNVPLPVKTRPFEDYISEGQNIVPQERGNFLTNAWDKLQNLRFDNPILEGISTVVSPLKWGTALGKALTDWEPLTEGQRLAAREWERLKDPDDIEDARAEYKKQFGREPSVEDINPTLQQQAQRHGGRTPWEIEQEAQQAEQEALIQADLDRAVIETEDDVATGDDPDSPDTPDPSNYEMLPDWVKRRLERNRPENGIGRISPPYTGVPGIDERPTPNAIPTGFIPPMTYINPGDYPEIFVNDSTGQIFTAPSLGYVPPAGWRRMPSGERERIDWKGIPGTFRGRIGV